MVYTSTYLGFYEKFSLLFEKILYSKSILKGQLLSIFKYNYTVMISKLSRHIDDHDLQGGFVLYFPSYALSHSPRWLHTVFSLLISSFSICTLGWWSPYLSEKVKLLEEDSHYHTSPPSVSVATHSAFSSAPFKLIYLAHLEAVPSKLSTLLYFIKFPPLYCIALIHIKIGCYSPILKKPSLDPIYST